MNLLTITDAYAQQLMATAAEVFEQAAFAMVDDPDFAEEGHASCHEQDSIVSCVRFSGPFTGRVIITVPAGLARELAANMLGLDMEDPESDLRRADTIGELLNMVCGNLLPAIAGAEPEFAISPPEHMAPAVCSGVMERHPAHLCSRATLLVEEEDVCIGLFLDSPAGGGAA